VRSRTPAPSHAGESESAAAGGESIGVAIAVQPCAGLAAEGVEPYAVFWRQVIGELKICVVERYILNVTLAVANEISDVTLAGRSDPGSSLGATHLPFAKNVALGDSGRGAKQRRRAAAFARADVERRVDSIGEFHRISHRHQLHLFNRLTGQQA